MNNPSYTVSLFWVLFCSSVEIIKNLRFFTAFEKCNIYTQKRENFFENSKIFFESILLFS